MLIYASLHSFLYRENRVPHYQRLFQNHDGKRQWWKVSPVPIYGFLGSIGQDLTSHFIADPP